MKSVKYLKIDVINQIKNNMDYYFNFFNGDYEFKLVNEFSQNYFEDNKFPLYELSFIMNEEINKKKTDIENSIEIYEKYKYLTESQASDQRFWTGLALEKNNMYYLFYRWGNTVKTIRYRLLYHTPGKRGYMYHGLARPWWFAHLTYDEKHNDPYHLTRFTYQYPHIMEKMIYRNFSNSKKIRTIVIEAIQSYIIEGGIFSTKKIDKLYKYIGLLGSNRLLDVYDPDHFKKILIEYLSQI